MRAKAKQSPKTIFRKWGTLVNGPTLYVKIAGGSSSGLRGSEEVGPAHGRKPVRKLDEPKEMNALLKKLGATKMTANESRKFKAHLST